MIFLDAAGRAKMHVVRFAIFYANLRVLKTWCMSLWFVACPFTCCWCLQDKYQTVLEAVKNCLVKLCMQRIISSQSQIPQKVHRGVNQTGRYRTRQTALALGRQSHPTFQSCRRWMLIGFFQKNLPISSFRRHLLMDVHHRHLLYMKVHSRFMRNILLIQMCRHRLGKWKMKHQVRLSCDHTSNAICAGWQLQFTDMVWVQT